ncbi:MAG: hypothetical protein AABM67_19125 [Acidobacteriota bacterium]
MKKFFLLLAITLLASVCSQVNAQPGERMGPPPVLFIVREDIKPGKMPAHNTHSANYARIFRELQTPNHRIAMVPVAGSENEVIYITPLGTFKELEQANTNTDKKMSAATGPMRAELDRLDREAPDLHNGMRDLFAIYRSELSFDPGVDITKMRYFAITTVRVRPGQDDQYAEYVRTIVNAARTKAKAELHIAAFQVIAGSQAGTYMFFRPLKSLDEYDLRIGARVREMMSSDEKKKADKIAGDSVAFSETSVYAFNPRMSYVPKEFVDRDPAFWNPKPEPPPPPKPRRPAPKKPPAPPTP